MIKASARKLKKLATRESIGRLCSLWLSLVRNILAVRRIQAEAAAARKQPHLVVLVEYLGDIVASEPVLRHLARQNSFIVWVIRDQFADILAGNPSIDRLIRITCLSEWIFLQKLFPTIERTVLHVDRHTCGWFGIPVRNPNREGITIDNYYDHGSLLGVFSLIGLGVRLNERPRLYLERQNNETYAKGHRPIAVVHAKGVDFSRDWNPEHLQGLVSWLTEELGYSVVEVGLEVLARERPHLFQPGSSWPLWRHAFIIKEAALFVGIDSGFAHVANAYEVPSAIIMGAFRHFKSHMPYSGPWASGIGCRILRARGPASEVTLDAVKQGVVSLLSERAPDASHTLA
jgi:heptosyltransferase III